MSISRILFATDFSDCAARAQRYAWWVAAKGKAIVDVVHVVEFQPGMDLQYAVNQLYLADMRADSERHFEKLKIDAASAGVTVRSHQLLGIPSERINELATQLQSDVVVMGTHGRTGLEHIVLGSTAERVVRGAPCPVLTVRGGPDTTPTARRIIAAIDFSECSIAALEHAAAWTRLLDAQLSVVHVLEPVGYGLDFTLRHATEGRQLRDRMEGRLADVTKAAEGTGMTVQRLIHSGLPVDGIVDAARDISADLIVMGTHGRRGISHLVTGSVAAAVLRKASCPVLTVKAGKSSEGAGVRREA